MIDPTPDAFGKVSKHQMLVVGIGAAAGGMEALTEFFEHVPAHTGLAYLIMLNLSPDQDIHLADVLE